MYRLEYVKSEYLVLHGVRGGGGMRKQATTPSASRLLVGFERVNRVVIVSLFLSQGVAIIVALSHLYR